MDLFSALRVYDATRVKNARAERRARSGVRQGEREQRRQERRRRGECTGSEDAIGWRRLSQHVKTADGEGVSVYLLLTSDASECAAEFHWNLTLERGRNRRMFLNVERCMFTYISSRLFW